MTTDDPTSDELTMNEGVQRSPKFVERDIARRNRAAVAASHGANDISPETLNSLESDGRTAAKTAHSYFVAALETDLTSDNWNEIAANLNSYGHNLSSEKNTWQPVSPTKHRRIMQSARDAEIRKLRLKDISTTVVKRGQAIIVSASTIGSQIGSVTRDQHRNLGDEERALVDGLGLLGARRGFNSIPQPIIDYAVKKSGVVGTGTRKVLGWLNRKHKTIVILQRAKHSGGANAAVADNLLRLLEHSDKSTSVLIDEIAKAKMGTAPDFDIRAMLSRRTHIELARFRYEL